MGLDFQRLEIPDVLVIRPQRHVDSRGFFSETYSKRVFRDAGIDVEFVQDNHSLSAAAGTVRGLHFQAPPYEQAKLVRVIKGRIFDVVVDIRKSSPTFGKFVSVELSTARWEQLFIPVGFAHGLCTLEPDTEVVYKVSGYYSAKHDLGIRWNDPEIGINWPVHEDKAQLSEKDRALPFLSEAAVF